jgi:hypothetical protein
MATRRRQNPFNSPRARTPMNGEPKAIRFRSSPEWNRPWGDDDLERGSGFGSLVIRSHVTPTLRSTRSDRSRRQPVLECAVSAGSQTRSLDDDVLGMNPKNDWKRLGDSISTLGQISSALFV